MDFTDILHTRQSCRNFDPARAPDEGALRELLEAGRLAPSACNSQPYHFHVARGAAAARVAALTQGFGMNKFTGQCPCFIVIAQRPYTRSAAVGAKFKRQDYRLVDIGLAAGNIVSRACELGLGTCMLGWFDEEGLQKLLGTDARIHLVIAVGYAAPGDPLREKKRKPLEELATWVEE